jgi:hypothetical protein
MQKRVTAESVESIEPERLPELIMDAFRRIVVHYGHWYAQVEHQLGQQKVIEIERDVWRASIGNQITRLGKVLDFQVDGIVPLVLKNLPVKTQRELLKSLAVNWLANDGIWFQAVETAFDIHTAKRCNDSCWTRFAPYEASRIKELLHLPDQGGLQSLKTALAFRMYAQINRQSIEDVGGDSFIFRMCDCRVQSARKRKGLADYPCKSAGLVEFPQFAKTIDKKIHTECIGCPPDDHPAEWYCAWRFSLK